VQALLEDNRHLSIAYLTRRVRDLEADLRAHFRQTHCPCQGLIELKAAVEKLQHRIEQAKVKFMEIRHDVDRLQEATSRQSGV